MAAQPHLLIVDDEPNVLFTLAMIFQRLGYTVTAVDSAAKALELLSSRCEFDVVLTDLNMESDDIGLEVAAAAGRCFPRPVIVIMTGFSSVSNAHAALHLGVDYYAMKPIEVDILHSSLTRLLQARADRLMFASKHNGSGKRLGQEQGNV